ncbi:alpha/beta hydrolase [Phycicoccus sonneratiae]|uniref:Alpha/beta fold hydrolase n=1 Tax=Phycicoccus sonneratiae TaxID=2807628 RepID=A0ABS2CP12_9MICO|nr:alpha/beta fold hydrolase [Phycicoccus sonneraticus]MBM6401617.1 alpha/beta fold hydrolase [Phycicoccus sonneraticus]
MPDRPASTPEHDLPPLTIAPEPAASPAHTTHPEPPVDPSDLAAALLSADGGGGAELRGHVPEDPQGVVLVLHGGAERSHEPVSWRRLAVVRMLPFATALQHGAEGRLAVLRLKYRVRGWNGHEQDPVHDARWALERIRRVLPGAPVALVGHSMGGRVALQLAAEPDVAAVAALAPWVEGDARQPRADVPVLLMHGTGDRMTDPRRTAVIARRWEESGADVTYLRVPGEKHAMLRRASYWHRTVTDFVTEALLGPAPTR